MIPSRIPRPSVAFIVSLGTLPGLLLLGCSARRPSADARQAEPQRIAATRSSTAMPEASGIEVTVVDERGLPQDYVDVHVVGEGDSHFANTDLTDEAGRFQFVGMPAGRYRVSAYADGRMSDVLTIDFVPGRLHSVTLLLRRGVALEQVIDVQSNVARPVDVEDTSLRGEFISKAPGQPQSLQDVVAMMPGLIRTGASDSTEISIGGGTSASIAYRVSGALPNPRSGENYRHVAENPVRSPLDAPLSTFAIDVDTASYSIARSWLDSGLLPPPDAVRVEEFINAFHYDHPGPVQGDAFAVTIEVAGCPWDASHRLVRIAIQGAEVNAQDIPPSNLVFLVDVSGSMSAPNKLRLVQQSLRLLVDRLRPEDTVGIVVYAGAAGVVLEPTGGADKATIARAVDALAAGGSTAGAAGIRAAYALAEKHFRPGGVNRVILATDGDFNVGVSSEGELVQLIEEERAKGVFLTVLGFGTGNYQDAKMEQLADHGNGNYAYVDSLDEGRRVLVAEAAGTLYTIAKDVKIQVEFNPAEVAGYRLIGYENRLLADEDFDDDTKDGGEIGAGHSVTALYEITPAGGHVKPRRKAAALRYQEGPEPSSFSDSGELMTVKLRWKMPDGETSDLIETQALDDGSSFEQASDDLRWSAAAAAYAMLLRRSPHVAGMTWSQLDGLASGAMGRDEDGRRAAMVALARKAAQLQPAEVGSLGR